MDPNDPTPTQPPVATGVVPFLTVPDAEAAITWYCEAFGASVLDRAKTPDGRKTIHATLRLNGGLLYLADDFPDWTGQPRTPEALKGSPAAVHMDVAQVDHVIETAVAAGAAIDLPVADMFWGARYGRLRDPFGHIWSIATPAASTVSGAGSAPEAERSPSV